MKSLNSTGKIEIRRFDAVGAPQTVITAIPVSRETILSAHLDYTDTITESDGVVMVVGAGIALSCDWFLLEVGGDSDGQLEIRFENDGIWLTVTRIEMYSTLEYVGIRVKPTTGGTALVSFRAMLGLEAEV